PTRNLLRHDAKLGDHSAGEPADPHFETAQVGDVLDLLAEPAAHLGSGVAGRKADDVELFVEVVHQLHAAAMIHPGILHARVEAEWDRGAERKGRILAEIVVGRGVAHLDRAVLHRISRRNGRNDLSGGEDLDLKLVVGGFRHRLAEDLGRAKNSVERLWEARRQAPAQLGRGLRNGRLGNRAGGSGDPCRLQEMTTLHGGSFEDFGNRWIGPLDGTMQIAVANPRWLRSLYCRAGSATRKRAPPPGRSSAAMLPPRLRT